MMNETAVKGDVPSADVPPADDQKITPRVTSHQDKVMVFLGREIAWLVLSPADARELARQIIEKAEKVSPADAASQIEGM